MMREKVLLRRLATAKRITLPNKETILARYERTGRRVLPGNITIKNNRKIGLRQQRGRRGQQGGSLIVNALKLG